MRLRLERFSFFFFFSSKFYLFYILLAYGKNIAHIELTWPLNKRPGKGYRFCNLFRTSYFLSKLNRPNSLNIFVLLEISSFFCALQISILNINIVPIIIDLFLSLSYLQIINKLILNDGTHWSKKKKSKSIYIYTRLEKMPFFLTYNL